MARRERDIRDRQVFEREFAEAERLKEEARTAPIRKAGDELSKVAGKLLTKEREAALHGIDEMAASLLSDEMRAITPERSITMEQAAAFNEREAIRFAETTPEFYPCSENAELITGYCTRNQIQVCDAQSYRNIFNRLNDLGLMMQRPAPEPEPEAVEQPAATSMQPEEFAGIDPLTGQPRVYTRYEVETMDSATYRRAFRIPSKWQAEYESKRMGQ